MDKEEREVRKRTNAVGFAQNSRRKKIVGAICIIVALLFLVASFFIGLAVGRGETDAQERSLLWMIDTVEENYREEVSRDELFDRLYDALELDLFCAHYTPEEYADLLQSDNGNNEGYGISFTAENGAVRIYRVTGNSPADLAGLRKGMYVYALGEGGEAASSSAVTSYLGARDEATLLCGFGTEDARPYTLRRATYHAAFCRYADSGAAFGFRGEIGGTLALTETGEGLSGLPADTAYLAIDKFQGDAAAEFAACLRLMKARGRKHLVIDLRGNGGGSLNVLCDMSTHLMRRAEGESPVIMKARFRNGDTVNYCVEESDFSDYFEQDAKICVLADETSASASEALIGVLISYGTCGYGDIYLRKGTGIAKTYGKGVMQSRFTAPDGNALRLTVADVYWPNGVCIHGTGVTEEDGAIPVPAPLLPGETDEFLRQVFAKLT